MAECVPQLFCQCNGDSGSCVPAGIQSLPQTFQNQCCPHSGGQSLPAVLRFGVDFNLNSSEIPGIGGCPCGDDPVIRCHTADSQPVIVLPCGESCNQIPAPGRVPALEIQIPVDPAELVVMGQVFRQGSQFWQIKAVGILADGISFYPVSPAAVHRIHHRNPAGMLRNRQTIPLFPGKGKGKRSQRGRRFSGKKTKVVQQSRRRDRRDAGGDVYAAHDSLQIGPDHGFLPSGKDGSRRGQQIRRAFLYVHMISLFLCIFLTPDPSHGRPISPDSTAAG